tara:strand:- start:13 stop:264 length:252 start_codon:yes stop_codon:yes gene_type:complete
MFEIVDCTSVPGIQAVTQLPSLPIKDLPAGKAIRVPIDQSLSAADLRKLHGSIRVRVCRVQAATGNHYRVTKDDQAIYVSRLA